MIRKTTRNCINRLRMLTGRNNDNLFQCLDKMFWQASSIEEMVIIEVIREAAYEEALAESNDDQKVAS